MTLAASHQPAPAGDAGRHVQVPHDLINDRRVRPIGRAVWAILGSYCINSPRAYPYLATIMRRLGMPDRDTSTARQAIDQLVRTEWASKERRHINGVTRNVYTLHGRPRRGDGRDYAKVTDDVLAMLEDGRISVELFDAYLRWLERLGRTGHTSDSVAELAKRWGETPRTVRRHRSALVAVGLLEVHEKPGKPTVTALPGVIHTPDTCHQSPRTQATTDPGHVPPPQVPVSEVPVFEEPGLLLTVGVGTVRNARATSTAPSAQTEKFHPEAGAVLADLPDPYRAAAPWVRRELLRRISAALDAGYGSAAIVRYARRHTDPTRAPGREIPELDRVLAALHVDADLTRDTCRTCGQDPTDRWRDHCPTCKPIEWTDQDAAQFAAACARLGVDPAALADMADVA